MEVQIGVAKINKYASAESGDTLEVIERPSGGLSVVLADGQRSGKSAKRISNMVVRKVITLLAEGVRDGAAARAASDYLYSQRDGKVVSTLNILSVDMASNTLVLTRNNPIPMLLIKNEEIRLLDEESKPVGVYRNTRPIIEEVPLEVGLTAIAYTDGLATAGERKGEKMNLVEEMTSMVSRRYSPQEIADTLMNRAIDLDDGRPADDISVVALRVLPYEGDEIRRLSIRLPLVVSR